MFSLPTLAVPTSQTVECSLAVHKQLISDIVRFSAYACRKKWSMGRATEVKDGGGVHLEVRRTYIVKERWWSEFALDMEPFKGGGNLTL